LSITFDKRRDGQYGQEELEEQHERRDSMDPNMSVSAAVLANRLCNSGDYVIVSRLEDESIAVAVDVENARGVYRLQYGRWTPSDVSHAVVLAAAGHSLEYECDAACRHANRLLAAAERRAAVAEEWITKLKTELVDDRAGIKANPDVSARLAAEECRAVAAEEHASTLETQLADVRKELETRKSSVISLAEISRRIAADQRAARSEEYAAMLETKLATILAKPEERDSISLQSLQQDHANHKEALAIITQLQLYQQEQKEQAANTQLQPRQKDQQEQADIAQPRPDQRDQQEQAAITQPRPHQQDRQQKTSIVSPLQANISAVTVRGMRLRSSIDQQDDDMDVDDCFESRSLPEKHMRQRRKRQLSTLAPRCIGGKWTIARFSTDTTVMTSPHVWIVGANAVLRKFRAARAYLEVTGQWKPHDRPSFPPIVEGRKNWSLSTDELKKVAVEIRNDVRKIDHARIHINIEDLRRRNRLWYRLGHLLDEWRRRGELDSHLMRDCLRDNEYTTVYATRRFIYIVPMIPGNAWEFFAISRNELGNGNALAWDAAFGGISSELQEAAAPRDKEVMLAIADAQRGKR